MTKEAITVSIRELVTENLIHAGADRSYRRGCEADLRRLTAAAKSLPGHEVLTEVVELVHAHGCHSALVAGAYFRAAQRLEAGGMTEEALFFYRLSHYLVPDPAVEERLSVLCPLSRRPSEAERAGGKWRAEFNVVFGSCVNCCREDKEVSDSCDFRSRR